MIKYTDIKTDTDINKLADLAYGIWHEYWPCLLTDEQIDYMVDKFQSFNAIKNQITNDNYIYNIIENNNQKAGYFGISTKYEYMFLSKLYIKKEFRRQKLGQAAFLYIIELAKKYNKPKIRLTVNKYNTNTINAYKKWGFYVIDSVVTDIGQGFVMDDYIMEYLI